MRARRSLSSRQGDAHRARARVWRTLARQPFLVVGMVSARGQGRTAGVAPAVHDRAVWFAASSADWKVRHIRHQPEESVTVPVPRAKVLALLAPVPPASITFPATAEVVTLDRAPEPVRRRLLRLPDPAPHRGPAVLVRLRPHGDFVTYGVGVPVWRMLDTEAARGRVAVAPSDP